MSALLLRLAGPLQSWGYRSRFSDRDTGLEPTKSGVVGLLCCALGHRRSESPADLAKLRMHVRVDRQGTLLKDFHTAGGGVFRGRRDYFAPTSSGNKGKNPHVTERHYLQDASFLVALEGNDDGLLKRLAERLKDPHWPLALGRRSCPPSELVFVGETDQDARTALCELPLRLHRRHLPTRWDEMEGQYIADLAPQKLRLLLECLPGDTAGDVRRDVPVAWPDQLRREYTVRFVREETIVKIPEVAQ
jgi:CRISPR system Cascade subunit CasD